ncbi:hypothetical protein BC937DRAFT_91655 [Endogone sp. FLAS-F59071]|nr:hypothetical protein BC937DRAFT_91655 [Endogone sp. FLAS-F59071]|eukprot:RUS16049.1 hypothetical protein BC937DRAFT_91655 [Endogone sp. FLAS-F59071]
MTDNSTDPLICDGTNCPNLTPTEDWQNLLLRAHDKRLVNRISLRLQLAISVLDILRAIEIIFLGYCLLNAMIAFNLHWVFLLGNPADSRFEKWYYIISFVLGSVPPGIVFILGRFDWDPAQQYCWFKDSWTTEAHLSEIFSLVIWCLIPMLYSLVVVIAVAQKLHSSSRQIAKAMKSAGNSRDKATFSDIESKQRKTQHMVHRLITRILLYPLIPLITQGPYFLSELWMICRIEISWAADLAGVISTDLPGILNFIAFMVDPAFHNSLESIRKDLLERYAEENVPTSKTNDFAPYDAHTRSSAGRSTKTMSPVMRWFVRVFLRPSRHDISGGSAFYRMSLRQQGIPVDSPEASIARKTEARSIATTGVTPSVSAIVDVNDVENDWDDDDLGDGLPRWATGYDVQVATYETMTQNL